MFRIYVDGTPIRVFKNMESSGVPYINNLPMKVYASVWNGDQWATRGGAVKTNWTEAPFVTWLRNYKARGCVWMNGQSSCNAGMSKSVKHDWYKQRDLELSSVEMMKLVKRNQMVYDYCNDVNRFPKGIPQECHFN